MPKLTRLGEELRFLLITSGAAVAPINTAPAGLMTTDLGVSIAVTASSYEKCARCWHRRADVGQDLHHPELCLRCVGTISGKDEQRRFI
jgi:isoleucyl-tRNA synthetase